jgi:predicted DNA-binding protein with PD1-like motif
MDAHDLTVSATYRVVVEAGDDWREGIERVAADEDVTGGWFTGIGTVSDADLWQYDPEADEHRGVRFDEPLTVAACTGEVGVVDSEPVARPYAVLTRPSGQAVGGYLNAATAVRGILFLQAFEESFDRHPNHDGEP